MLKIRLQRVGRKHDPHFRVVVTDARRGPKSNKFIEVIGTYNAKLGVKTVDNDRAAYWISVGAQASDTVYNMLVDAGVVEGRKRNALPKKTAPVPEVVEEEVVEAPAAEETPAEEAKEEAPAVEEAKEEEAPAEEAAAE